MTTPDHEPLLETLRGDPALSRVLRTSLQALREQSGSEEFRSMVDDVLAGRRHLRDVFISPAFAAELDPLVQRFGEQYEALPDDERQRLSEQGQRQLAEENERVERERAEQERNRR